MSFTDILSKRAADTPEPKPYPTGTYHGAVQSLPEQRSVDTKDGPRSTLRFKLKAMAPRQDVDQEKIAEQAEMSVWPAFNHDIWIDTPQGEFALQQFLLNTLGLELGSKSYSELLPESVGKQLLFTLGHTMGVDKNTNKPVIYTNVTSTAHL